MLTQEVIKNITAITHSSTSPPPPSPPIPVPLLPPHHIASQPLKSAIIRAHNIPECDYVYTIVRSETDFNSLKMRISTVLTRMVIEEGVCNDMGGDVVIEGLNCLRSILVKKNSMKNLNSLKICNCELLEKIEVNGDQGNDNGRRVIGFGDRDNDNGAFENVKNVEISSLIDLIQLIRSSSIDYIHYRRLFILLHNFIEFNWFD